MGQRVFEFLGTQGRVERHEHHAGQRSAVLNDGPLQHVRGPEGNIAAPIGRGSQRRGDPSGLVVELCVGQARLRAIVSDPDERRLPGVTHRPLRQYLTDGEVDQI